MTRLISLAIRNDVKNTLSSYALNGNRIRVYDWMRLVRGLHGEYAVADLFIASMGDDWVAKNFPETIYFSSGSMAAVKLVCEPLRKAVYDLSRRRAMKDELVCASLFFLSMRYPEEDASSLVGSDAAHLIDIMVKMPDASWDTLNALLVNDVDSSLIESL